MSDREALAAEYLKWVRRLKAPHAFVDLSEIEVWREAVVWAEGAGLAKVADLCRSGEAKAVEIAARDPTKEYGNEYRDPGLESLEALRAMAAAAVAFERCPLLDAEPSPKNDVRARPASLLRRGWTGFALARFGPLCRTGRKTRLGWTYLVYRTWKVEQTPEFLEWRAEVTDRRGSK